MLKSKPPNVMVLEGWAFGMWLHQKGGVLINGINALLKETSESSYSFPQYEDIHKMMVVYKSGNSCFLDT